MNQDVFNDSIWANTRNKVRKKQFEDSSSRNLPRINGEFHCHHREVPLPKRCKYHRNVRFRFQTVARAIENQGFQFFLWLEYLFFDPLSNMFFLMPYFC
jgi:hypothetical protein